MPIIIGQQAYYRTTEVCERVGVSRFTLLQWLRSGVIEDSSDRDRRGWRLFTEADVKRIADEVNRIERNHLRQTKVRSIYRDPLFVQGDSPNGRQ